MKLCLMSFLAMVTLPGTISLLARGDASVHEANAHDDVALLQVSTVHSPIHRRVSTLLQTSEEQDQEQCHVLLQELAGRSITTHKLEARCQKAFPKLACNEARDVLKVRPWSTEAINTACKSLGSAGSFRLRARLQPLLLQRRSHLVSAQESEKLLDASLKRKDAEEQVVAQPPYAENQTNATVQYVGGAAAPYNKTDPVFVHGVGNKTNADDGDTTMWCGNSSYIGNAAISPNCPPGATGWSAESTPGAGLDAAASKATKGNATAAEGNTATAAKSAANTTVKAGAPANETKLVEASTVEKAQAQQAQAASAKTVSDAEAKAESVLNTTGKGMLAQGAKAEINAEAALSATSNARAQAHAATEKTEEAKVDAAIVEAKEQEKKELTKEMATKVQETPTKDTKTVAKAEPATAGNTLTAASSKETPLKEKELADEQVASGAQESLGERSLANKDVKRY